MQRMFQKYDLLIFFIITLLFSGVMMTYANHTQNDGLTMLVPLSPSILAILIVIIANGWQGFKALVPKQIHIRFNPLWILYAIFLIPLLALTATIVQGFIANDTFALLDQSLIPAIIIVLLISLGEEFGWRGFALPRLQKHFSPLVSSLILGSIWGFWHYPGYLSGVGTPLEMPFFIFMLWVIPATILITWGYNATNGSIIVPILMHSSANLAFAFLPLLPEWTGEIMSFRFFLGILWTVVAIVVLWTMQQKK